MSIGIAYKEALKKLKRDARPDMPGLAKRMRIPYNTIKSLVRGNSMGSIRTWLRIERFYVRQNKII